MDEVGVDAIRYFFTMRGIDSHLDFDMDLAVSQSNENPVYYVQYAHARICSIYRQAEEQGIELLPLERIELERLPDGGGVRAVAEARRAAARGEGSSRTLCTASLNPLYLELASMFHSYYKAERIITEDAGSDSSAPRLGLLCTHRPAQCPAPGRRIRPGTHVILVLIRRITARCTLMIPTPGFALLLGRRNRCWLLFSNCFTFWVSARA